MQADDPKSQHKEDNGELYGYLPLRSPLVVLQGHLSILPRVGKTETVHPPITVIGGNQEHPQTWALDAVREHADCWNYSWRKR